MLDTSLLKLSFNHVTGETLIPARWAALETARLQAPERMARAFLGSGVAFAGRSVFGGQPGSMAFGSSAGDALVWDTDVLRVRFLAAEFAAVEGFQPTATITNSTSPEAVRRTTNTFIDPTSVTRWSSPNKNNTCWAGPSVCWSIGNLFFSAY